MTDAREHERRLVREGDDIEAIRVRVLPMPDWPGQGHCRWCSAPILKDGALNRRRTWHSATRESEPDCLEDYKRHTDPVVQFRFIAERDGEKCWDCGITNERAATVLEIEHDIPLWLVTHLEPAERRRYFGPTNLRLRCRECHAKKTAREAGTRAKTKRIARDQDPETRWRSPHRLRGRGFGGRDPLR